MTVHGKAGLALGAFPTPLEAAPRLAETIGIDRLLIKREDLAGPALGGNKIRKLELLLADARAQGCDAVLTTAGLQSNLCRALAGVSARLGLHCALLLRGSRPNSVVGNLLLDELFGAEVRFLDVTDPWDPRARAALDALAEDLRRRGHRPYLIHLPGQSAALGVEAWARGAAELDAQFAAAGLDPDRLIVACGSGLTLAGLALGFKRSARRCRVTGISVQQPASRLKPWIVEAAGRVEAGPRLEAGDFDVVDGFVGPAYGVASPEAVAAVRLAARTEGLVLDPVYTGKAMAGLIAGARDGSIGAGEQVVFLHSGGLPGFFAQSALFADAPA
ncbi:MAG: pyridoxal-phosphate dependent enzyme [Alphaproteobacteria bacterium]|nr:pyridoxal-phosphate dependent enzyme [Alphaproteobacteria bacterium]